MEIGTKPIPISVLTAVTNSALNAASVFPSRRIGISDFPYRFEPVVRHFNIQVMDALCKILKSRPFVPGMLKSAS